MGPSVRRRGGVLFHIIICIYSFLGLAIVCDHYFVKSLDRICEGKCNIKVYLNINYSLKNCTIYTYNKHLAGASNKFFRYNIKLKNTKLLVTDNQLLVI